MTDQGSEFKEVLEPFLATFGVLHEMVPPTAHWRMSLAERHGPALSVFLLILLLSLLLFVLLLLLLLLLLLHFGGSSSKSKHMFFLLHVPMILPLRSIEHFSDVTKGCR